MLINCPRCGFSQPMDQYCAQCGVDMQSFKPIAQPFYKKLFSSGLFQVGLLILIAAVVGQYIMIDNQPQIWSDKLTRMRGAVRAPMPNTETQANAPAVLPTATLAVSQDLAASATNELTELKTQEIAVTTANESSLLAAGVSRAASSNAPTAVESAGQAFKIIYAEVKRETLAQWIAESESQGLYQNLQEYSAGIISDFRAFPNINMNIIDTLEKKIQLGQNDVSTSAPAGDTTTSLSTLIELRGNENGTVRGRVTVGRRLGPNTANFPAEFELPKGAIFFMVGALKPNQALNEKVINTKPFSVFRSHDFMTQKTEFVIIIEPDYK